MGRTPDKEKAKEIVLEKAKEIKTKAEELYKYAIEKSTPVVERAADEVRKQALKVVKEAEKNLVNDEFGDKQDEILNILSIFESKQLFFSHHVFLFAYCLLQ